MDVLDTLTILLFAVVLIGWINEKFLKIQDEIGLLLVALVASVLLTSADQVIPSFSISAEIREFMGGIDFYAVVMVWMLPFLLFGDALHTDVGPMMARKAAIAVLAIVGTVATTMIIGTSMYFILNYMGVQIPYLVSLVFGAIVSPTDPIAVIAILKKHAVPKTLEAKVAGESLFNDGVGIVVFAVLTQVAFGTDTHINITHIAEMFAVEAIGGVILGLAIGYAAYRWTATTDRHTWEVMLTVVTVFAITSLSRVLGVSGALGCVIAGLFTGNHGQKHGMVENTREYLHKFWQVIHNGLIGVLFLLIGVEVFAISHDVTAIIATGLAIMVSLIARFIVVADVIAVLSWITSTEYTTGAVKILTWGGVHGGISIALALAIPDSPFKDLLLTMTYGVVIFSIVVQGLTMNQVIKHAMK